MCRTYGALSAPHPHPALTRAGLSCAALTALIFPQRETGDGQQGSFGGEFKRHFSKGSNADDALTIRAPCPDQHTSFGTQFIRYLGAEVAGVERAGDGGVLGAFDDGAAVREHGEFVGRKREAEKKIVVADFGGG